MLRDDIPLAGLIRPPLTTVRQPVYELGRHVSDRTDRSP
jgi:DNA-binding LacI/PurR family transcriptional regulator